MVTGISRFTKGEFSQVALDEVWNKGRELYKNPTPPPSSGIQLNSVEMIWNDMHDGNTGQPVASSMAVEYVQGPTFRQFMYVNPPEEDWSKINAWFEIEEGAGDYPQECAPTQNFASNTMVEITAPVLSWQKLGTAGDGKFSNAGDWYELEKSGGTIVSGGKFPAEHGGGFSKERGCPWDTTGEVYNDIREQNSNYEPEMGRINGNYLYKPNYYWWYHGWTAQYHINPDIINAVFSMIWVRVILIDPNGEDDRHRSNYVVHACADKKNSNGGIVGGGQEVGGISRYKKIPTNGDWMPTNWITGWIDEASLIANPPPFPTTP